MHLLIFGGTGPTGILLLQQALAAKHTLVIYARSPSKIPEDIAKNPSVTVITGQVTDEEAIDGAVRGVDAVLSVLGPNSTSWPGNTPIAHAYAVITKSMKKHNVSRLILMGTGSIKDPLDKFSFLFSALVTGISLLARNAYKDIVAIGNFIREQDEGLDWTIVRVGFLNDDKSTDVVAGYIGDGKVGAKLSRAAFAAFFLHELEHNEWVKKAPLISSP